MAGSTLAKVVIPPVAPTEAENRHVYEAGSTVVISLYERSWLSAVPPMLLSRLTTVQPAGAEIIPADERRAVTTASMRSPGSPAGRAIVIAVAFDTRSVVLSTWPIPSPAGRRGAFGDLSRCVARVQAFLKSLLRALCPARTGAAEEVVAPASKAVPMRMMQAPAAIDRGRLPNMPGQSASYAQPITPLTLQRYLFGVGLALQSPGRRGKVG
jgi:hypothetical protein